MKLLIDLGTNVGKIECYNSEAVCPKLYIGYDYFGCELFGSALKRGKNKQPQRCKACLNAEQAAKDRPEERILHNAVTDRRSTLKSKAT